MSSNLLKAVVLFFLFFVVFEAGYFFGQNPLVEEEKNELSTFNPALPALPNDRLTASINIVAVASDGTGQVSKGNVEIVPNGQGRVLIDTNPFVEPDTQQSLEIAAVVASSFAQKSLADKDIIYSVSGSDAQLIGGPSAGAAFTVATIAAIEGKNVRQDAAITGTINPDGSIGPIGGVVEKMNALAEQNAKLFLVPKGQSTVTTYVEQVLARRRGSVVYEMHSLVPKQVNLVEMGQQQGIEVREVSNIAEAVAALVQ